MDLELDERQRAMLLEMGVHVWLPQQQQFAAPPARTPVGAQTIASVVLAPAAAPASAPQAAPSPRILLPDGAPVVVAGSLAPLALQGLDWQALSLHAAHCEACGLCAGRKRATLQAQDIPRQVDWLLVGEPPDEDEDRLAQPFVGQAGLLLDNMLSAVGASRSGAGRQGAYLSNVVKCRPPQGRLPQAAELAQCAQYLQREIALVRPKVIVAMGRFAAQLLLSEHPEQVALPLGKQRGSVYHYHGVAVVVTYHPQLLLRGSAEKAKAWADLCLAMDVLDGEGASLQ